MNKNSCAICLGNLNKDFHVTSCGHKYHKNCINKWHNSGGTTCPVCRKITRRKSSRNLVIEVSLEQVLQNNVNDSLINLMKKIGKLNTTSDVETMETYISALFDKTRTRPLRIPPNIPQYNKIVSIKNSIVELNLNTKHQRLLKKFTNVLKEYMIIEALFN